MSKTVSRLAGADGGFATSKGATGASGEGSSTLTSAVSRSRVLPGCTGYERLVTRWLQGLAPRGLRWKAAPAMEASATPVETPSVLRRTRHFADRIGDRGLHYLTAAAAILILVTIGGIVWKVLEGAWPAIQEFGLSFIWESGWNPITEQFAAWQPFIVGTLVTSFGAVLLAAPLSIA